MSVPKIGLGRKSALSIANAASSVTFVTRFLSSDHLTARDLLIEYLDSPIALHEKITVLAYCSRYSIDSSAELAAWVLCEQLNRSLRNSGGSARQRHRHIRWLTKCRRGCRNPTARAFLKMASFQLGEKHASKVFLNQIAIRNLQLAMKYLDSDQISPGWKARFRQIQDVRLIRALDFLHKLRTRRANRVLAQIGRIAKDQWIRINAGTILVLNGCRFGLVLLSAERVKLRHEQLGVPRAKAEKYRVLFGLVWGGVLDAADEFDRLASAETEEKCLEIVFTLAQRYGPRSPANRNLIEKVKQKVECRIAPDRLRSLNESHDVWLARQKTSE